MITHLDHVAIAVENLDEAIQRFVEAFGLRIEGREDIESEQTTAAFLPLPGTRIELVAPLEGAGPIAKSLSKRGPGVHHLCFRTDDIESDMKRLAEKGYQFTSDTPRDGAHGTKVVFIHPRSTGGVLIELAEHP